LKKKENMIKSKATLFLKQMIAYERCMKTNVVLNPLLLNRWLQEGQVMQGHKGEDLITNIGKSPSGCGRRGEKKANELREDEGIGWSKLGRIGMMGKWMEVET